MIVVLDTNVCISALHLKSRNGTPGKALQKAVREDVIATCDELDAELIRVLRIKFNWNKSLIEDAFTFIRQRSIRVQVHGIVSVCRDPDDNKVLECAERAKADLIVTGDHDLLVLGSHARTKIITPAEYLNLE